VGHFRQAKSARRRSVTDGHSFLPKSLRW
jgi:hypothetical protein